MLERNKLAIFLAWFFQGWLPGLSYPFSHHIRGIDDASFKHRKYNVTWSSQDGMTRTDIRCSGRFSFGERKRKFNKMQGEAYIMQREREWAGRSRTWPASCLNCVKLLSYPRWYWIKSRAFPVAHESDSIVIWLFFSFERCKMPAG